MHSVFSTKRCSPWLLALVALAASGCVFDAASQNRIRVVPLVETDPVPSGDDSADDSAIWVHPQHAGLSLVVATDKRSGLLLYDLHGKQRQYLPLGKLNNVDLRQDAWHQPGQTLIAASQRDPARLVLLSLDPTTLQLQVQASHPVALERPYGICLFQDGTGQPFVIMNGKSGRFIQFAIDQHYRSVQVRQWSTDSQSEGCVADDATARLFLGEEEQGIWVMSALPGDPVDMRLIDTVENGRLHSDVEGLALYGGDRTMLIASSQGDSSFAIYDANTAEYLGSFQVTGNAKVDGVSNTDGVAATTASLPGFERGMLVVHDGHNDSNAVLDNSNFKFISWADIAAKIVAD